MLLKKETKPNQTKLGHRSRYDICMVSSLVLCINMLSQEYYNRLINKLDEIKGT